MLYFPFDDPLKDLAGDIPFISEMEPPALSPGVVAGALNTDPGSPSEIYCIQQRGRIPALDSYPYSVSALVKTSHVSATFGVCLQLQNNYSDVPQGIGVIHGDACLRDSQTSFNRASGAVVSDGQWHHLCGVFEASPPGGKRLFLDGSLVWTNSGSSRPFPDDQFGGTANDYDTITVGANWRYNLYDPSQRLPGLFDSVRVYKRALSVPEIQTLAAEVPS